MSDPVWKEGAVVNVALDDMGPRPMRVTSMRRTGPNTTDITLEAVPGPDVVLCTCPYIDGPTGVRMGTSRACAMHGEGGKERAAALLARLGGGAL